jgi:hypothetical protein
LEEIVMAQTNNADEVMFIVIGDIDGVSDLFFDRDRAEQYAKVAEGSVFRLVRVEEEGAK